MTLIPLKDRRAASEGPLRRLRYSGPSLFRMRFATTNVDALGLDCHGNRRTVGQNARKAGQMIFFELLNSGIFSLQFERRQFGGCILAIFSPGMNCKYE